MRSFHTRYSAIQLCQALAWPHELTIAIGREALKRSRGDSALSLSIEALVEAMHAHLKLHQNDGATSVAAEKSELVTLRASNQGWSPRSSVVK